ncbi:unnamed protein product [Onchocerca flexuosa]|uniref:DUF4912 domain-containing protein n=1 Tax=Onchocerca flexuosa TaxID=387005 RepID=A0A183HKC0_9BILA|nr:unnamed protein product [Onchocerca flexuosa]
MLLFHDFRSLFRYLSLLFIIHHGKLKSRAAPVDGALIPSRVQDFRARYDHATDAIYIHWSYPDEVQREG